MNRCSLPDPCLDPVFEETCVVEINETSTVDIELEGRLNRWLHEGVRSLAIVAFVEESILQRLHEIPILYCWLYFKGQCPLSGTIASCVNSSAFPGNIQELDSDMKNRIFIRW